MSNITAEQVRGHAAFFVTTPTTTLQGQPVWDDYRRLFEQTHQMLLNLASQLEADAQRIALLQSTVDQLVADVRAWSNKSAEEQARAERAEQQVRDLRERVEAAIAVRQQGMAEDDRTMDLHGAAIHAAARAELEWVLALLSPAEKETT